MIYVDTSLLLPVYVPEAGSEQANQILDSVSSSIIVSDLTVAEFYVGLARKVKLGELSEQQAADAGTAFELHITEGLLQRVPLRSSHSEGAGQLAFRSTLMIRTLDALHLAVAVSVEATVATFDTRLTDAAKDLGIEVLP